MKIQFATPPERAPRLLADVELHFQKGEALAGLKLVGFKLWRKPHETDELYVTLPSRAYNTGRKREYFDFLRSDREVYADTDGIRVQIIDEWRRLNASRA